MSVKIAVIGSPDSVSIFRVIGCRVYETGRGGLTDEQAAEISSSRFEIIYVTEEAYRASEEFFKGANGGWGTITIIPDIKGAAWKDGKPLSSGLSMEEIRMAVIKAIGQDISGSEE